MLTKEQLERAKEMKSQGMTIEEIALAFTLEKKRDDETRRHLEEMRKQGRLHKAVLDFRNKVITLSQYKKILDAENIPEYVQQWHYGLNRYV